MVTECTEEEMKANIWQLVDSAKSAGITVKFLMPMGAAEEPKQ